MQSQYRARLLASGVGLLFISIEQQVQERAVHATRSLDDPRNVPLLCFRVRVAQVLAAELAVAGKVPVLPPEDAFPFPPPQPPLGIHFQHPLSAVRPPVTRPPPRTQAGPSRELGPCAT